MKRRFHFSWPAFVVMVVVVTIGVRLGAWQLSRSEEKREWLTQQAERGQSSLTLPALLALDDPAHYRVVLQGQFDNDRNILLDNRIHQGVAGYHVLTPFHSGGRWVLVNRGWIPRGPNRATLPEIPPVPGIVSVPGHTYIYSSKTFTLTDEALPDTPDWPLRVQSVEMEAIGETLGLELAPFEIRVAPEATIDHGNRIVRPWQDAASMPEFGPERHQAYALQWFLLAVAAFGVYLAASFRKQP